MPFVEILGLFAGVSTLAMLAGRALNLDWLEAYPLFIQISAPQRVRSLLIKPAHNMRRLMGLLGDASLPVSAIVGAWALAWLVKTTGQLIKSWGRGPPTVLPPIPGFTLSFSGEVLFALFFTLLVHELGHAYSAVSQGLEVKKIGFFMLFLIPGAFVEIDEEALFRAPLRRSARILSSGVGVNAIAACLVLLTGLAAFHGFPTMPSGVYVEDVVTNGPSWGLIPPGTVIYAINSTRTPTLDDLIRCLREASPGELAILETSRGTITVELGARPDNSSRAWLGVLLSPFGYYSPRLSYLSPSVAFSLARILLFLVIFNLSAAAINALPALPLDIGRILAILFSRSARDESLSFSTLSKLLYALSGAIWGMLGLNLVYSVIKFAGI
ncbi:MAG TPA: RIP metalloprotease [Candidatus Korarchaeota archaeon]|nr:RIP metalloprotease [Candidatus Korarchaeota archaeon]